MSRTETSQTGQREEKQMKQEFIDLLRSTKRNGIEDLIKFLEKTYLYTSQ